MDEQQCVWKCEWTFRLEQQWIKVKSLSEEWLLTAFLGGQWCSILLSVFIGNLGPRMKCAFWKFVAATKLGKQSVCWDKCLQFRGSWSGWRNGLSVTSWRSVKAKKQRLSLRLKQPHSTVQAGGHMIEKRFAEETWGSCLIMNQEWALTAIKFSSIWGSFCRRVAGSSGEVIIVLCFALTRLHMEYCLSFWAPKSEKEKSTC